MASRMFLKLGDIKGSCEDDSHKEWIEIMSFNYGVANSINCVEKIQKNPGGEACSHQDISLSKILDKTSPQLYAYGSVGKMFPKAEIDVCEEKESLFKITIENTALSSVSVSGGTGDVPYETLVLAYSKIAWQYKTEAEQSWDLVKNTGTLEK